MMIDADWMLNLAMFQRSNVQMFKCSKVQIEKSNVKCQFGLTFVGDPPVIFLHKMKGGEYILYNFLINSLQ